MIKPDLQRGTFVEVEIAVGQESGDCANGGSNAGAYGGATPTTSYSATKRANARSCARSFHLVPFVHAAAFNLAFFIGRFNAGVAGHSGHGRTERKPDVLGVDVVKAEQQAGVELVLQFADGAFDHLA